MATSPVFNRLKEDFLSCPICAEEFRRPKALHCQHTFCEQCLHDYIVKTSTEKDGKKGFLCPICREFMKAPDQSMDSSKWATKINNNFVVYGIQDMLKETEEYRTDTQSDKETRAQEQFYCEKHSKTLDYYCADHGAVVCHVCVVNGHRACAKVKTCEEAATEEIFEVSELVKSTELNRRAAEYMDSEIKSQKIGLERDGQAIGNEIKLTTSKLVAHLNNLEQDLLSRLEIVLKQRKIEYDDRSFHCKNILSKAKDTTENLQTLENHHPVHILQSIVERKKEIKSEQLTLQETNKAIRGSSLVWFKDETLENVCLGSTKLGNIEVNTFSIETPSELCIPRKRENINNLAGRFPKLTATLNASTRKDYRYCWITGAAILDDKKIVLADRRNKSVKLFSASYEFINCIRPGSSVFDVTTTGSDEVAVSLPKKHMVQYFTTSSTLTFTKELDIKQRCYGLTFGMDKLFVCCQSEKSTHAGVKIFNRDGSLFRHIFSDNEGMPIFTSLSYSYIAFCHRRSQFCVTDQHSHHRDVVTLLLTGELKTRYSFDYFKNSGHGLAFYKNSTVVALPDSTVCSLGPEGQLEKLLEHKSVLYPTAVSIDSRERTLVVSQVYPFFNCSANGIVKIFQLECE